MDIISYIMGKAASGGGGGGSSLSNPIRYIRMTVSAVRNSGYQCQFSEIEITDGTNVFLWPSGTTITSSVPGATFGGKLEGPSNLIDGDLNTKYNSSTNFSSPITFDIDLGASELDVSVWNAWRWYTANDTEQRDPISFSLSLSNDGINYTEIDSVIRMTTTTQRKAIAYTGTIVIP